MSFISPLQYQSMQRGQVLPSLPFSILMEHILEAATEINIADTIALNAVEPLTLKT